MKGLLENQPQRARIEMARSCTSGDKHLQAQGVPCAPVVEMDSHNV